MVTQAFLPFTRTILFTRCKHALFNGCALGKVNKVPILGCSSQEQQQCCSTKVTEGE